MRTSFELKFKANGYEEAKATATTHIATFLGISETEVSEKVDTELKVEVATDSAGYNITAFSKLKTNFLSFGLDK